MIIRFKVNSGSSMHVIQEVHAADADWRTLKGDRQLGIETGMMAQGVSVQLAQRLSYLSQLMYEVSPEDIGTLLTDMDVDRDPERVAAGLSDKAAQFQEQFRALRAGLAILEASDVHFASMIEVVED